MIEKWRDYILDWLDTAQESIKENGYNKSEYEWLVTLLYDQYAEDGFLTRREHNDAMRVLVDMVRKGGNKK